MNCACRPKDALLCRSCLEHIQRKFGNSISFSGTPEIQRKAIELEAENATLVEALEKIEWKELGTLEDETPYIICPDCENEKAQGHKKDCGLEQALALVEGPGLFRPGTGDKE